MQPLRRATIRLYDADSNTRLEQNYRRLELNWLAAKTLDELQLKVLPQALQLTPEAPIWTITKVLLHRKDVKDVILNEPLFEAIRKTVLQEARSNKMKTQCDKYNLSVFVKDEQAIKKKKLEDEAKKRKRKELEILEEVERVKRESERAVAEAEEMAKALHLAEEEKKKAEKMVKPGTPAQNSPVQLGAPTPGLAEYHDSTSPPALALMTPQSKRSSGSSARTPGSTGSISPVDELEATVAAIGATVESSATSVAQSPALKAAIQAAAPVMEKVRSRDSSPVDSMDPNSKSNSALAASPGTPAHVTLLTMHREEGAMREPDSPFVKSVEKTSPSAHKEEGEEVNDEPDQTAIREEEEEHEEHEEEGGDVSLCSDYTEPGTYDTWQDVYTPSPMRLDAAIKTISSTGATGKSRTPGSASPYKITLFRPLPQAGLSMEKTESAAASVKESIIEEGEREGEGELENSDKKNLPTKVITCRLSEASEAEEGEKEKEKDNSATADASGSQKSTPSGRKPPSQSPPRRSGSKSPSRGVKINPKAVKDYQDRKIKALFASPPTQIGAKAGGSGRSRRPSLSQLGGGMLQGPSKDKKGENEPANNKAATASASASGGGGVEEKQGSEIIDLTVDDPPISTTTNTSVVSPKMVKKADNAALQAVFAGINKRGGVGGGGGLSAKSKGHIMSARRGSVASTSSKHNSLLSSSSSTSSINGTQSTAATALNDGSTTTTATDRGGEAAAAAGFTMKMDLSALSNGTNTNTSSGTVRPNDIQILMSQYDFMKAALGVQGRDGELEWMMSSKKAGAYQFAHNKAEECLDHYARLAHKLVEMEQIVVLLNKIKNSSSGNTIVTSSSSSSATATATATTSGGSRGKKESVHERLLSQFKNIFSFFNSWAEVMHDKGPHSLDHRQMEAQLDYMQTMAIQHRNASGAGTGLGSGGESVSIKALIEDYKKVFGVDSICKVLLALSKEKVPGKAIRLTQSISKLIPEEVKAHQKGICRVMKEQEEALVANEMWIERETGASDYAEELDKANKIWFKKEASTNKKALEEMRGLIPVSLVHGGHKDSTHMTEKGLLLAYHDAATVTTATAAAGLAADMADSSVAGVATKSSDSDSGSGSGSGSGSSVAFTGKHPVLPHELAAELYSNKLLHWVVTHHEDIAKANFLTGPHKAHFEGIDKLDVTEMRAIAMCLPDRFELDTDGKKAAWKARFMARVKILASRQNGETAKGGWNPLANERFAVPLQPLSAIETRRDVYFYRPHSEMQAKQREYSRKAEKVKSKREQLAIVEQELTENKAEYQVILAESRDAACKEQFGLETLSQAKKLAMDAIKMSESKKRQLISDIRSIEETIKVQAAHCSQDDYNAHLQEVTSYITSINKEVQWKRHPRSGNGGGGGSSRVPVLGVFDRKPSVLKSQRAVVRTFTLEEEAAKRKEEMLLLQSSKKEKAPLASATTTTAAATAAAATTAGSEQEDEEEGDDGSLFSDVLSAPQPEDSSVMDHHCFNDSTTATATGTAAGVVQKGVNFAVMSDIVTPGAKPRKANVLSNLDPVMLASLTKALSTTKKAPLGDNHYKINPGPGTGLRARAPLSPSTRDNTAGNTANANVSTPIRNLSSALNSVEDSITKVLSGTKATTSGIAAAPVSTKSKVLARLLGQEGEEEGEGDKENSSGSRRSPTNRRAADAPSFLDAIKARGTASRKVSLGGESLVEEITSAPAPVNAAPPSFLDAIKARRVD